MTDAIEKIRHVRSFRQLGEEIRRVEFSNLDSQDIVVAAHKIAEVSAPEPSVRIALLGTHTFQPLPSYLSVRAAASQKAVECWCGPYGQYMQPLSPPSKELQDLDPDIVLLSAQMRSIAPRVFEDFGSFSRDGADAERRRILDHLVSWADLAVAATNAVVLVSNFPRPRYPTFGVADAKRVPSEIEFYARLNSELFESMRTRNRCSVFDLESVVAGHGAEISWTRRAYYLSKQAWQPGLCTDIARELWRHVIATKGWSRKCLVLDLDNTIWGGVVGEDGPQGIRIGPGDPEGEAYADFQRAVRGLKARGVLLAIASKNNPDDVDAAFAQRRDMPLHIDDFATMEIGWESKAQALDRIAETLNIGLESIVFLDDSPAERLLIRNELPQVVTPEMPDDPGLYASFLKRQAWFERPVLTAEDVNKTQQYKDQSKRAARQRAARSAEEYLAELGTCVEIRRARRHDVPRLQQLFAKTNQFNVTTRRYGAGQIGELLASGEHEFCVARAVDRYGDLGQIGLYVLETEDDGFRIDSFLLSCRALGRGIESALMNSLKASVQSSAKAGLLRATFIPTPRNAPARDFFAAQGLEVARVSEAGEVEYQAPIGALREIPVPHIQVSREQPRPAS